MTNLLSEKIPQRLKKLTCRTKIFHFARHALNMPGAVAFDF